MPLTVFSTNLNHIARSLSFTNEPKAMPPGQILPAIEASKADIFEQLLLFDKINFKVYGESVLLPILINFFGLPALEALIEQKAIGFTLWTPMVGYMVNSIPGVDGLIHGTQSSPSHSDPQQSVELGLRNMTRPLLRSKRRGLTKKLVNLYELPSKQLAADARGYTKSAYNSGKLAKLGLDAPERPFDDLSQLDKGALTKHADRLMEYRYLLENDMTSFSSYDFFALFRDTTEKINAAHTVQSNFLELTTVEDIPDLKALRTQITNPLEALPKIRARRSATKFREWIEKASLYDNHSIRENYLAALEEGLGFFQTTSGRVIKTITVSSIGLAIGRQAGGLSAEVLGAGLSALAAPLVEPVTGIVWDQIDEFMFNGLTKGWTPRMFFNDLRDLPSAGLKIPSK